MSDSIDARYQIVPERTLPVIASEIHQIERTVYGVAMDGAIQIGEKLKEAKEMVPAGEWVRWLDENLNYSQRQAYNFMEISTNYGDKSSPYYGLQTSANLSISKALELLRLPDEEVASFVEENDIESETVKSLREKIREVERERDLAENNNEDLRKDLAREQRKNAEAISEEEFDSMKRDFEVRESEWQKTIRETQAEAADTQAKLDKAKEDLKKAKEKLKASEAAKDEEIQKRVEAVSIELTNKAKEEAFAESEAELKKNVESIKTLEKTVERLEAEKAKLSNTALMEFKVYVDQLQDIYFKISDIITEESLHDEQTSEKMRAALRMIVEGWRP